MSITHFLDKSVIIQRLKTVSGNRKNMVSTMTIDMHIQDAQNLENAAYYAAFEATHKAWVDENVTIHDGDRVIDSDGNHYIVVNILPKQYAFAMNPHNELMLKINNG